MGRRALGGDASAMRVWYGRFCLERERSSARDRRRAMGTCEMQVVPSREASGVRGDGAQ